LLCRRDEALAAIQSAQREQAEQEAAILTEVRGYKRDIVRQQVANESLTAVLHKVEAEAGFVAKQSEAARERQGRASDELAKLVRALEHAEAQLTSATSEAAAIAHETAAVDRAVIKVWFAQNGQTPRLVPKFLYHYYCSGCRFLVISIADLPNAGQRWHEHVVLSAFFACYAAVAAKALTIQCSNAVLTASTPMIQIMSDVRGLEEEILVTLSDQTTAEKSTRELGLG
jgi:hypothetical protein